ncbi:MAG: hypothetical protein QXY40_03770 [Candidatus Methanomethylicia archaeon]
MEYIKRMLEAEEGMEIDSSNFTDLLERLVKMGILEKKDSTYKIADPITQYGIIRFL